MQIEEILHSLFMQPRQFIYLESTSGGAYRTVRSIKCTNLIFPPIFSFYAIKIFKSQSHLEVFVGTVIVENCRCNNLVRISGWLSANIKEDGNNNKEIDTVGGNLLKTFTNMHN